MIKGKPKIYKSDLDFEQLEPEDGLDKVIKNYNSLAKGVNFLNKFLSFQSNFGGYIAEVTIPAGREISIQHFLGLTPKWRVILRQEGNGVISDIPSGWNDKFITLRNNGTEEVKASILIAKE
jgi:hypothetical protein